MICFNCRDIGHHLKDCKAQIKRVFCHGCKMKCKPLNSWAKVNNYESAHPQNKNSTPRNYSNPDVPPTN